MQGGKNWILPMQAGSSWTLIGWKSGQTTYVPLWDRMEGTWLRIQDESVHQGNAPLKKKIEWT